MEGIGKSLSISDRKALTRASEICLLITRACGRLNPLDEQAKPYIALELACQELGILFKFPRSEAARFCNRSLAIYMKLCDSIVNSIMCSQFSSELRIFSVDLLCNHFPGCTVLIDSVNNALTFIKGQLPWKCLIGAVLIVLTNHACIPIIPMKVAEFVHVQWREMQLCIKSIKEQLDSDYLNFLLNEVIKRSDAEEVEGCRDIVVKRVKKRSIAYLLSGQAKGIYAHIGPNPLLSNLSSMQ